MNTTNDGGPAFPIPIAVVMTGNGDPWVFDAQDRGIPGQSLRAYAAIKLRVPESGIDWLDDMIRKAIRDKFAGQAMAAMCAGEGARMVAGCDQRYDGTNWNKIVASNAYSFADAMLAERAKKEGGA